MDIRIITEPDLGLTFRKDAENKKIDAQVLLGQETKTLENGGGGVTLKRVQNASEDCFVVVDVNENSQGPKQPELEFEEIALKKNEMNPTLFSPFELEGSHRYHERKINLTKLFKLKGTDFYLFGGELEEIVRPLPPNPVFRYIAPNDGVWGYSITESTRSFAFSYTNYHLTEGWDYQDGILENFPSEKYDHLFPEEGYRFYVEYDGVRREFKLVKVGNELELYDFETGNLLEGDVELGTYRKSFTSRTSDPGGGDDLLQDHNFETTLVIEFNRQRALISIKDKEGRSKPPQLHWTEPYDSYNTFYLDIVTIGRYD